MEFKYSNLSLYNREEILNKLNLNMQYSNQELLVKAYQTWGENFLNEINGDFAFALYDSKKNELFAARDPLGIKALYYTVADEQYYFSENIDELFQLSGMKKQPNIKSMYTLLNQRAVDYEETMYHGINRIPPGHYLKIIDGKVTLVRYWYPEKIQIDYSISLENAAIKFNQLFEEAIMSRIDDDEETAYELSGGLDSSSIVSVLKTKYPEKVIDTYSMCFNGFRCDEYQYVRAMENKFSFHTVKIDSRGIDYKDRFDFKFNYRMSPHWPITTTFTMLFHMAEKMSNDEKKIVITGQGGDHLLGGHCYVLADLLRRLEFGKALNELTHTFYSPSGFLRCGILPLLTQKQKEFIKKIFSSFYRRKNVVESENIADLFCIKDIASVLKRSTLNPLISAAQSTIMDGNVLHAIENTYHIEFRHPFFDKKLVEFVLSLPPEYRYSQGKGKVLLRRAMEKILPEKIRLRKDKAEFSEVLVQQLHVIDINKLLKKSNLASLGLIEQRKIDAMICSFENRNYSELVFLWIIVNLEYWYRNMNSQE